MVFFTNKNLTKHDYLNLFEQKKVTVVLENKKNISTDLSFVINQILSKNERSSVGLLCKENVFFPYLSLIDNLFIGSDIKEKNRKNSLKELLCLFQLTPNTLFKSYENLTSYEQTQIQLIRILLSNKQEIVVDDVFSQLTIYQRQHLLPLLKEIAEKKEKAILLFTSDRQIAESSYINKIIIPATSNC